MADSRKPKALRFNGSVWCNLDIALRNIDHLFNQVVEPLDLSVIETYILRSLYDADGQNASELARAVGRAATSFTPILDKLQAKKLVERQPDPVDRRAVRIFLTDKGHALQPQVLELTEKIDNRIRKAASTSDMKGFNNVLALLQELDGN